MELFPYQQIGAEFLASRKYACLFDEQGVGKSAQAIRACDLINAKLILVVARAVGVENWKHEFQRFSRTSCTFNPADFGSGGGVSRDHDHRAVFVTSYESLHKIDQTLFFDVLIVDEAHYCKEPTSNRTRRVLGATGAIHRAKRSWFLTGTPTPNHAGELWPLLYALGRTQLSQDDFIARFCKTRPNPHYGRYSTDGVKPFVVTGTDLARIGELKPLIKGLAIRRTKLQVLEDLPPIHFCDVIVKPSPVDIALAPSFVDMTYNPQQKTTKTERLVEETKTMARLLEYGERELTVDDLERLKMEAKSIMTIRRFNGLQKIGAVVDLVTSELESGAYEKIVLFAIHRDTVDILRIKLQRKFKAVWAYGGTKQTVMQERVARFQRDPSCRVFVGNIECAGTSITLTAANQVMFVEQSFVPGDMAQAAMRCHRIGQKWPVTVRFVGLADSVDRHLANLLRRKTAEVTEIMNGFNSENDDSDQPLTQTPGSFSDLIE